MKWAVQTRLGPNRAPPVISPQPDDMMHAVTTLKLARAHACCARVEAPSGELRRVCAGRPGQLLPLMCWCVTSMLSPPGRPSGSLKSLLRACLCGAACNLPSTQPRCRPRRLLGCHAETEASLLGQLCGSPSTPPNSHMATDVAWLSSALRLGGGGRPLSSSDCSPDLGLALLPLPHGQRSRLRSPCDGPRCLPSPLPDPLRQPSLVATCCHCQRRWRGFPPERSPRRLRRTTPHRLA